MKILFCGGGTAGHITPALSIAEEHLRSNAKNSVLFVGRTGGNENALISRRGFPYKTINVKGLRRKLTPENLSVIRLVIEARKQARQIIKDFEPDAIIGTGGYVCWPVISVGRKMNIPIFIHESNIYPGLTTKLLAKKCDEIFLYGEESINYLPKVKRYKVTGNPISKDFFKVKKEDARQVLGIKKDEIMILSFGGSLGSERLNIEIIDLMKKYSSKEEKIHHVHATGKAYYSKELSNMFSDSKKCKIVPFINEMHKFMKAADIVICRAGAMTLAEISACGAAAILIPSPNVSDDHQYKNASLLSQKNAAIVIRESELTSGLLQKNIEALVTDEHKRRNLSKCIELFAKNDVEKVILKEVYRVINEAKKTGRQ